MSETAEAVVDAPPSASLDTPRMSELPEAAAEAMPPASPTQAGCAEDMVERRQRKKLLEVEAEWQRKCAFQASEIKRLTEELQATRTAAAEETTSVREWQRKLQWVHHHAGHPVHDLRAQLAAQHRHAQHLCRYGRRLQLQVQLHHAVLTKLSKAGVRFALKHYAFEDGETVPYYYPVDREVLYKGEYKPCESVATEKGGRQARRRRRSSGVDAGMLPALPVHGQTPPTPALVGGGDPPTSGTSLPQLSAGPADVFASAAPPTPAAGALPGDAASATPTASAPSPAHTPREQLQALFQQQQDATSPCSAAAHRHRRSSSIEVHTDDARVQASEAGAADSALDASFHPDDGTDMGFGITGFMGGGQAGQVRFISIVPPKTFHHQHALLPAPPVDDEDGCESVVPGARSARRRGGEGASPRSSLATAAATPAAPPGGGGGDAALAGDPSAFPPPCESHLVELAMKNRSIAPGLLKSIEDERRARAAHETAVRERAARLAQEEARCRGVGGGSVHSDAAPSASAAGTPARVPTLPPASEPPHTPSRQPRQGRGGKAVQHDKRAKGTAASGYVTAPQRRVGGRGHAGGAGGGDALRPLVPPAPHPPKKRNAGTVLEPLLASSKVPEPRAAKVAPDGTLTLCQHFALQENKPLQLAQMQRLQARAGAPRMAAEVGAPAHTA